MTKEKIKKVRLRSILHLYLGYIRKGDRMYELDGDGGFIAEQGYNTNFGELADDIIANGVGVIRVKKLGYTFRDSKWQEQKGGKIILRDNDDFVYEALRAPEDRENLHKLRLLTLMYDLDYMVDIFIESVDPKYKPPIDMPVPTDEELRKNMNDPGNHFNIEKYKNAEIIKGRVVPNKDERINKTSDK